MSVDFPWYVHYLFAVVWSIGLIGFTWYHAPSNQNSSLLASLVQSVLGGAFTQHFTILTFCRSGVVQWWRMVFALLVVLPSIRPRKCVFTSSTDNFLSFPCLTAFWHLKSYSCCLFHFVPTLSEDWKIQPKYLTDTDFWHAYWLGLHNIVATSIESGNRVGNRKGKWMT